MKNKVKYFLHIITAINLVLMSAGCDDKAKNTVSKINTKYLVDKNQKILFPRQKKPEENSVVMAALKSGQLILEGDCLQVKFTFQDQTVSLHTPIWPHDATYEIKEGFLLIKQDNIVKARLGERIKLGGGEIHGYQWLENYNNLHETLSQCPSPYWIAHFTR